MDTSSTTSKPLEIHYNKIFGYKIHGNYHLVKFSQILEFTDFSLKNRGIDIDHVDNIYKTLKSNPDFTMPPIELISILLPSSSEDKIYVGNGQHRFLAYKKLYENDKINMDLIVMFHDAKDDNDMERIIKLINSGKPVTTMFNFKERNEFIEKISSYYNNIFSNNTNHHKDKMNKITLRDNIDKNKIFNGQNNADDVFNKLIVFNEKIKKDYSDNLTKLDKELYIKIKESHKFFCLMHKDYTWVNKFNNYLKLTSSHQINPENIKEVMIEYKLINNNKQIIMISGDWDDWTTKENMIYDKTSNSYKITKKIHKGVYEYKFVINDKFELHTNIEKFINRNGFENHRLIIN